MVPRTQETLDEGLWAKWLLEHQSNSLLKALEASFFMRNPLENPSIKGMSHLQTFEQQVIPAS